MWEVVHRVYGRQSRGCGEAAYRLLECCPKGVESLLEFVVRLSGGNWGCCLEGVEILSRSYGESVRRVW